MKFVYLLGCSLVAALLVYTSAGCQKTIIPDKNTLVVAIGAAPQTLDPRKATDAYGIRIASLIHGGLVNLNKSLEPVGELAESWTYKGKTYEFVLKPDAKFSNGRSIEAEDVEFSFAEFSKEGMPYKSALEPIEKVTCVKGSDGKIRVALLLKEFNAKLLNTDLVVVKILPKKEMQAMGESFFDHPIGSGLYTLKDFALNRVLLERSPSHRFGSQRIEFKIIRDEFTRYQKMAQGGLDIAQAEISPSKIRTTFLHDTKKFQVISASGLSMTYLLFNLTDPLFQNIEVRRALNQAVNRQEIIQYKMDGFAKEATTLIPISSLFFNASIQPTAFDPQSARKTIKRLGLENTEIILKTSNNQSVLSYARVIAHQLGQIGIKVKLQSYEWGKFFSDVNKGMFQMASLRWVGTVDPDIYRVAYHSAEYPPGRNRGKYKNERVDKLVIEGLNLEDVTKRKAVYDQVQRLVSADVPMIPLWYEDQVAVINRRVKGYDPSPVGDYQSMAFAYKEQ